MIQAYDGVRQQLQRSAGYNKRYYDIGVRPSRFEAGQWVWYFNPRKLQGKQMKWTQQYEGPYLILQMHTTVVAEIQQSSRTKPKSVHIDKLKKFEGEEPKVWPAAAARISTARQGNHDDAVRVDASSLWENERSHRETEEAVRTTGEVHFGSAESAEGPTNPFPVLGVKRSPLTSRRTLLLPFSWNAIDQTWRRTGLTTKGTRQVLDRWRLLN